MRRLPTLDLALLAIIVPLWLGCFALHLREVIHGRLAWVPVIVSAPETAAAYPTVREFWSGTEAQTSSLVVGDQLVRIGEEDLRGIGPIGFVARAYEHADTRLRVPLSFVRAGEQSEISLHLTPVAAPWRILLLVLGFAVIAVFVLIRAAGSPPARAFFLAAMAYSLHWAFFFGESRFQTYVWIVIFLCSALVIFPLTLRAVLIFPEEILPTGIRMPLWPWTFAVVGLSESSWLFGVPFSSALGLRAIFIMNLLFIVTLLVLLTRNFRRAGPIGRRQLKWVVYGFYIGTVPVLAANIIIVFAPSLWWLHEISMIAPVLIPICLSIAIIRYNFFDIDRLISATTTSSILLVVLVGCAILGGPQAVRAMSGFVGIDTAFAENILQLALIALVVPGQRYVHPWIERWFFPERHALESGVNHLLRELSDCEGPHVLLTLLSERLSTLLQPECCILYGRVDETYTPTFIHGSVTPSLITVESALVGALHRRVAPLDVDRWRRTARVHVNAADQTAVDNLRAVLILPVSRDEPPTSFVCLGRKRSGDVYTQTDYALLTAVADKAASELLRFEEAEAHRQTREMQEALRRYVPEPVAARLGSGQELEAQEQEISVLFVDIRGYTTYSEGRDTAEVFSLVNRYTETVSGIVRHHQGTVAEFHGDGMMAVFGAPEPLAEKERAAVEAGREIVTAVRSLALGGPQKESRPLEVGVGIATGKAFVGNIQSVDRLIWSAIGDTTNLAARLQSLTRDLHAAIVVDAATWDAAAESAADFTRYEHIPIRGRRQSEDVYVLPLAEQIVMAHHQ